ncbi:MAG: LanC-like protein [Deltaproteobacteria bacterium]|nr:LanC-like protein [Deltaproteobacteria bacterium]
MLYDPARHELLTDTAWDEARARAAIEAITADVEAAFDERALWPTHPLDGASHGTTGDKCLYHGAAGVIWAQVCLAEQGMAKTRDWSSFAEALVEHYRAAPDTGTAMPSFWLGEVGVLLTAWRLDRNAVDLDVLFRLIEGNRDNVADEQMWGAPGTMLAALFIHEATGDPRWRALFDADASALMQRWHRSDEAGCSLWTHHLYGEVVDQLGAGHGMAGNAFSILRGGPNATAKALAAEALHATAIERGGLANWPQYAVTPRRGRTELLVQWCHGAPGMITSLSALDDDESDRLLRAGGELVWKAGPLAKGAGLCHGTAGNGFAFLELFRRTGDELWLDRARRFAMHAIEQSERLAAVYGRLRYSLWNGDAGVAVYLHGCLGGRAGLPLLDAF